MNIPQALGLGLVQGITEFLPISSSGHLLLLKVLLGLDLTEIPLLFDVALHLATLGVIVFFVRQNILRLLQRLLQSIGSVAARKSDELRLIQELLVATMATALVGYGIGRFVPLNNLKITAIGFTITALLLFFQWYYRRTADRQKGAIKVSRFGAALLIGLAQGAAVLPGISRAGATICMALMVGLHWRKAVDFSLLLSIPAILGALLFSVIEYQHASQTLPLLALLLGMLTALVIGAMALHLLIWLVRGSWLHICIPYLLLLSIVSFLLSR